MFGCGLVVSDPQWVETAGSYEQRNKLFLDQLNDY
jgi:hypothetical protein